MLHEYGDFRGIGSCQPLIVAAERPAGPAAAGL